MFKYVFCAWFLLMAVLNGIAFEKGTVNSAARRGCAGVTPDGRFVTAVFASDGLLVDIMDQAGQPVRLTLEIKNQADTCAITLDAEGGLIAIAAHEQGDAKQGLQIGVADSEHARWIARFTIDPSESLPGPLAFHGFFKDTSALVVTGAGVNDDGHPPATLVNTLVVSLSGQETNASPASTRVIPGHASSQQPQYVDAKHNRLWFPSYPQFCPLQSTTLIGEEFEGPKVDSIRDKLPFCDRPDSIDYPDASTAIMANTSADRDVVWRSDLGTHSGEQIELPRARSPNSDRVTGERSLSPDGRIFAFSRLNFSYGHLDNFRYKGNDIVLVQVKPLRLLGVVRPEREAYITAFAVDHRDSKAIVLFLSDGKWQRKEVAFPGQR